MDEVIEDEEERDEGGEERSCGCDGTIFDETRMQANLEPMQVVMSNMRQVRAYNCAQAKQTHYELERQSLNNVCICRLTC